MLTRLVVGRWNQGRPIYKKVEGDELYLLMGRMAWAISDSTNDTAFYMAGGRKTNTPTIPEAGGSVKDGVTRWRFANTKNELVEGNISVTCDTGINDKKGSVSYQCNVFSRFQSGPNRQGRQPGKDYNVSCEIS